MYDANALSPVMSSVKDPVARPRSVRTLSYLTDAVNATETEAASICQTEVCV